METSAARQAKPSRVERAKGRLVSVGSERLSEHAAESLIETHALNIGTNTRDLRCIGSDQRGSLVDNWAIRGWIIWSCGALGLMCGNSWNGL